jgi:hypothetical protein
MRTQVDRRQPGQIGRGHKGRVLGAKPRGDRRCPRDTRRSDLARRKLENVAAEPTGRLEDGGDKKGRMAAPPVMADSYSHAGLVRPSRS